MKKSKRVKLVDETFAELKKRERLAIILCDFYCKMRWRKVIVKTKVHYNRAIRKIERLYAKGSK